MLTMNWMREYGFGDSFAIKTDLDTANLLVTDFDIKEDFVGYKRTLRCANDIHKEEKGNEK
jgi:hypothetical protein